VVGPTEHFITNEVNYQAPTGAGDHTTDASGRAFAQVRTNWSNGWYFLNGIDVRAPRRAGAVVAIGDSITDGYQGSDVPMVESQDVLGDNARYPDFLDSLLEERLARQGRPDVGVLNAGISGNQVLSDAEAPYPFGVAALRRFRMDALRAAGARDVIVLAGINDLGNHEALRPAQLIRAMAEAVDTSALLRGGCR
jgi:lysophospholipase L1-like esterase